MQALDTNIIARHLLGDDATQSALATQLLESAQALLLPITVVLELALLLRAKGIDRSAIATALRGIAGLPNLQVQHEHALASALAACEDGLDFADALHRAMAGEGAAETLVTFDRAFVKAAKRVEGPVAVRELR